MIHFMRSETGSGSVAVDNSKASKQIRRYTSRNVRVFSSRDEFVVIVIICLPVTNIIVAFVVYLSSLYILLCDVSVAYGPLSQIN